MAPTRKLTTPPSTRRETGSAFYQLKLGHGYFKPYLFRFGHTNNPLCSCRARQTPEHLLLSCPNFRTARKALKDSLPYQHLTLNILLNTTPGIEACCQIDRPIQWNVMEHNGKSIQNSGWFGMQTSWSFWKVLKTIAESFQKLSGQSPAVYIGHTYPDRKDRIN